MILAPDRGPGHLRERLRAINDVVGYEQRPAAIDRGAGAIPASLISEFSRQTATSYADTRVTLSRLSRRDPAGHRTSRRCGFGEVLAEADQLLEALRVHLDGIESDQCALVHHEDQSGRAIQLLMTMPIRRRATAG
jgi:hypothetical protein